MAIFATAQNVRDATEQERTALNQARQRYEDCEKYLADLRAIKKEDDAIAFATANREMPIAIDERDEAAIFVKVAEGGYTRARHAAIAAVVAERSDGRAARLRKMQAALEKARAAYLDLVSYDEDTAGLLDGATFDRGFGFNIFEWMRPSDSN